MRVSAHSGQGATGGGRRVSRSKGAGSSESAPRRPCAALHAGAHGRQGCGGCRVRGPSRGALQHACVGCPLLSGGGCIQAPPERTSARGRGRAAWLGGRRPPPRGAARSPTVRPHQGAVVLAPRHRGLRTCPAVRWVRAVLGPHSLQEALPVARPVGQLALAGGEAASRGPSDMRRGLGRRCGRGICGGRRATRQVRRPTCQCS